MKKNVLLVSLSPWEFVDFFWWRCTEDPGCGPRKKRYVLRLCSVPREKDNACHLTISIPGHREMVAWIPKEDPETMFAHMDKLFIEYLDKVMV